MDLRHDFVFSSHFGFFLMIVLKLVGLIIALILAILFGIGTPTMPITLAIVKIVPTNQKDFE